ncbi:MAG: FAD-dependent oxidoreductase, partial [Anaerovoracaceae bacterium]
GPLSFEEKAEKYKAAVEEQRRLTAMLRHKNYNMLNDNPNVEVYTGTAAFIGERTVEIKGSLEGEGVVEIVKGEKIFINTGATPVVPPIPGLENNPKVYYSNTLMDLDVLPKKLKIIGGGYISMEFAAMYANFGSAVTVMQREDTFLPREDADVALAIKEIMEAKGVEIQMGLTEFPLDDADAILVATGRKPNTEGLSADLAGIRLTSRGAIDVDQWGRTTAENVWALGDVAGGLQFTYISLDDFRIVRDQLKGEGSRTMKDRANVPYSVFMDPPFSRVGMGEQEAIAAGYQVKVVTMPAAAIPKAQVLRSTQGLLKAIVDEKTKKILGAVLLCEESYELINLIKLAMDTGAEYTL